MTMAESSINLHFVIVERQRERIRIDEKEKKLPSITKCRM